MVRYTIKLTETEVEELKKIVSKGSHSTQTYRAAYILLNCDKGNFSDNINICNTDICKVLKVGARTIDRVKKRFIEDGFEGAIERKPSSQNYQKKVDGDLEAKLIALSCSTPPEGFGRWSLRLLADKMVELEYVDYISHVTVGGVLKKTRSSRGE